MTLHFYLLKEWKTDRQFSIHLIKAGYISKLNLILSRLIRYDDLDLLMGYLNHHRIRIDQQTINIEATDSNKKIQVFFKSALKTKNLTIDHLIVLLAARFRAYKILKWMIERKASLMTPDLLNMIAYSGNLDLLLKLRTKGCQWDCHLVNFAALGGHGQMIIKLKAIGGSFEHQNLSKAGLISGQLRFINWLIKNNLYNPFFDRDAFQYIISRGWIEIIKTLPRHCFRNTEAVILAAENQQDQIFNYILPHSTLIYHQQDLLYRTIVKVNRSDYFTMTYQFMPLNKPNLIVYYRLAAELGHLDFLGWFDKEYGPFEDQVILDRAAAYGRLNILETVPVETLTPNLYINGTTHPHILNWLWSKSIPVPDNFLSTAVYISSLDDLIWGVKHGCQTQLTAELFNLAVHFKENWVKGLVAYLDQVKCPYDSLLYFRAAYLNDLKVIKWLYKRGYKISQRSFRLIDIDFALKISPKIKSFLSKRVSL